MRRALLAVSVTLLFAACQASSDAPIIDSRGAVTPTETSAPSMPTPTVSPGKLTVEEVEALADRMSAALERVRTGHATIASGSVVVDADFRYTGAAPDASSDISGTMGGFGPYTFSMVVVNDHTYLSLDGLMPPGKYFRAAELDPFANEIGRQLVKLDPNVLPLTLEEAAAKVTAIGVEELYGRPVVHYRAQTVLSAVTAEFGGPESKPSDAVQFDVWLDPDALVRRVQFRVGSIRSNAEYDDWGKRVRIVAPRPGDIVGSPLG